MMTGMKEMIQLELQLKIQNLMKRFDPIAGGKRLSNYLKVMTLEAQTIARASGKNDLQI